MITEWKKITLDDVKLAESKIQKYIERTRLTESHFLKKFFKKDQILLKKEYEQKTNSFKVRGALNKILALKEKDPSLSQVVACSMGNHAQGVAFAAAQEGVKATIVMPQLSSEAKIRGTLELGAKVLLYGHNFETAKDKAYEIADQKECFFIPPYEDPHIIAGQGTVGLEIFEDAPKVDSVILPLGGGGLLSGVAFTLKQLNPNIKIYGVSPEAYAPHYDLANGKKDDEPAKNISEEAGAPAHFARGLDTLADGTIIKRASHKIYENYISPYVDKLFTVEEKYIKEALKLILLREKALVEGSGVLPLAAMMAYPRFNWGKKIVLVLSGGNIDARTLSQVLNS